MDAAVRYIVALQEHAGLDVVTDGEWRRKSYIGVIAELAHGFELGYNPEDNRPWTDRGRQARRRRTPGFIAREIAFLKTITSRKIKATLPAPALLGERMWDPVKSTKAYPIRNDFVRDCVPILRREIELIRDAGADIIQIDDPHLCLFVDPAVRSAVAQPGCRGRLCRRHGQLRSSTASRTSSLRSTCAAAPARGCAARRSSRAATSRSSIS